MYEYTLQHSGTVLRHQCKLHYTVHVIHRGSEPTDKTTVHSECEAHAASLRLEPTTNRTNNMIYLACTLKYYNSLHHVSTHPQANLPWEWVKSFYSQAENIRVLSPTQSAWWHCYCGGREEEERVMAKNWNRQNLPRVLKIERDHNRGFVLSLQ